MAAGGGMRHEDIALALGISRDTLEKHYAQELSTVAMQRRMEALAGVHKAAARGSSSAAKVYLQNDPQLAAPPAGEVGDGAGAPVPASPPAARVMGKKEAANAAATTAQVGTGWDGLLPGTGLVN